MWGTSLTWNIEGLKSNLFALSDLLTNNLPDLVFLSEPLIYQHDLEYLVKYLSSYVATLSSYDFFDPEMALDSSRTFGGTMVLWHKSIDPFITLQHFTGMKSNLGYIDHLFQITSKFPHSFMNFTYLTLFNANFLSSGKSPL